MNKHNPKFILRNYLAQRAIEKAEAGDGGSEVNKLLSILRKPYEEHNEVEPVYSQDTPDSEYVRGVYLTSC